MLTRVGSLQASLRFFLVLTQGFQAPGSDHPDALQRPSLGDAAGGTAPPQPPCAHLHWTMTLPCNCLSVWAGFRDNIVLWHLNSSQ